MNIDIPKVTISIPTYNQDKFIARAIESALMQDYENLEINISDDCSKDSTYEICKSFLTDTRINLYKNLDNIGRVENYRKLLYTYATGDWVINLDGDDYFVSRNFISEAISLIRKTNNVVLYHANFFDLKKLKTYYKASFSKSSKLISGKDYILNRCFVDFFFHLSALYNRETAIKCGFYSYNCLNTDALSLRTIALFGDVIIDSKKVGQWQLMDNSETHKSNSKVEIRNSEIAEDEYVSLLRSLLTREDLATYYKNNAKAVTRINLYNAIEKRDYITARKLFKENFVFDSFYLKQLGKYLLFSVYRKK